MKCKGIINLYNKTKLECNHITDDPVKFILDNSYNQDHDKLYLYLFEGNKYISVNSFKTNKPIIEKIEEPLKLSILWSTYGEHTLPSQRNNRINSTMKKLNNINNVYFKLPWNENEHKQFLYKLGQNNEIQSGGAILWSFQNSLESFLPDEASIALDVILDIVDIAIVLLSTVPGITGLKIFPGTAVMWDIISIIYSILRLDTIGTIAGIIALVPFVGDIVGASISIGSKIAKYIEKYSNFKKFTDKIVEARQFGYNYGDKYNEIVRFVAEFGDPGMKTVLTVLDFGREQLDIERTLESMRRLDRERLMKIINLVEMHGKISRIAGELGLILKEHAMPAVQNGIDDRVKETSNLVGNKINEINKNYQAK